MTSKSRKKAAGSRKLAMLFKWTLILSFVGLILAGLFAYGLYRHFSHDLPKIASLKDYRPPVITRVYADDGREIAEFFKERRIVKPLSEMPPLLIKAFVSAEDSRFYEHKGVDFLSILRAAIKNVEAGTVVQGGSTITQQVTKSFLLTPEKSYERKIREAILAYRIDKIFSKEEILYLYLNQIYLGQGAYGVAAAAENYFDKPVKELTLAECALLAAMPKAPSKFSPFRNFDRARDRQKYVLDRMAIEGYITADDAKKAYESGLTLKHRSNPYLSEAPYYVEHVRQHVAEKYGEDALYNQGLQIHTAVNLALQKKAREAIDSGLRALNKRHAKYAGPLEHLEAEAIPGYFESVSADDPPPPLEAGRVTEGVVTAVEKKQYAVMLNGDTGIIPMKTLKWATDKKTSAAELLAVGDVVQVKLETKAEDADAWTLSLEQPPDAQAALLCLETGTGHVKAMVGGRDFKESQFNRAIQSRRQPGSSFKPIIYASALDKGYTPATPIVDNVFIYEGPHMTWKPKNYDRTFKGHILMRDALTHSRNLSTINLLNEIGVDYVIRYAHHLGITAELEPNLSIALGSSGVSLLELTTTYSIFANQGIRVEPVFITKILDRNGLVLEEATYLSEPVMDETTAYLTTSLLESVVQSGTGRGVRSIGRPAAGKTGTTNDLNDAWFMGYTTDYVTGVWVGHDQEKPLGSKETGGRAAAPIWLDFMKTAHEGLPVRNFPVPKGIVFSKIDADTGLLPASGTKKTIFECFRKGTVPTRHSTDASAVTDKDQFFKMEM